jgi:hypothetical protein
MGQQLKQFGVNDIHEIEEEPSMLSESFSNESSIDKNSLILNSITKVISPKEDSGPAKMSSQQFGNSENMASDEENYISEEEDSHLDQQ